MKTKNRIWLIPLIVMGLVLILSSCKKKEEETSTKITDKDGNVYTSVAIGTQVWMVENLKTTKYNDNTPITPASYLTWPNLCTTPIYCWYNDDIAYKTPYGAMYTWFAVGTGKLCPNGWHVPSEAELITLVTYLGATVAGAKLKESGTAHWTSPNTGTNVSGFTGLPGGWRDSNSQSTGIGLSGYFWTMTPMPSNQTGAEFYDVVNIMDPVGIAYGDKRTGMSVRCLKD